MKPLSRRLQEISVGVLFLAVTTFWIFSSYYMWPVRLVAPLAIVIPLVVLMFIFEKE